MKNGHRDESDGQSQHQCRIVIFTDSGIRGAQNGNHGIGQEDDHIAQGKILEGGIGEREEGAVEGSVE